MREWDLVLRFVHDNIVAIYLACAALVVLAGCALFYSVRSNRTSQEVQRLRRRLYELQRGPALHLPAVPVVVPARWIQRGGVATSSDGGCLVLVEAALPARGAILTVRIDGLPAVEHQMLPAGSTAEIEGRSGTYLLTLLETDNTRAHLTVQLRSRHLESNGRAVR